MCVCDLVSQFNEGMQSNIAQQIYLTQIMEYML